MNKEILIKKLMLKDQENIEFISSIDSLDVGKSICAFLNSGGGYVICEIGSNRSESSNDSLLLNLNQQMAQDISPKALISLESRQIDNEPIFLFEVPAGLDIPYAYKNDIYIRESNHTIKASIETIRDMVMRRQIEPERWERRFSSADIDSDLSKEEIRSTVKKLQITSAFKFRDESNTLRVLEDLSVAKYGQITNAGDVLFALDPSIRYPQVHIRAASFIGDKDDDTYRDMKTFTGPLLSILKDAIKFINRNTTSIANFSNLDMARTDKTIYPLDALREGLVNALAHRDYSNFSGGVSVFVYLNRIEIWNAGKLPKGVSLHSLGHGQISILRNPDISQVLFLKGYMEKLGRGSVTIRTSCEKLGLPAPIWKEDESGVTLILFAPEVTPEVTPEATPEVTPEVRRVLGIIKGEMTRKDLQDLLKLKDDEHFRKAYLLPSVEAKLLELTIPDKPTSSKQKYRITKLGITIQNERSHSDET